jgi:hypothetical protein
LTVEDAGSSVRKAVLRSTVSRTRAIARALGKYLDCNPLSRGKGSCSNPVETLLTHLVNRKRFSAVAHPFAIVDIDPRSIRWNLRVPPRSWPLGAILDGNWDLAFRRPVDIAWKIVSMQQRFIENKDWLDTDLFVRFYGPQFARGETVRGAGTPEALANHYEAVYDRLFEHIRIYGFETPTIANPNITFLYVHLDRYGEPMFTLEGNHRLGIAVALGLPCVPVRVATRHHKWQLVREHVLQHGTDDPLLRQHPDLAEILRPPR